MARGGAEAACAGWANRGVMASRRLGRGAWLAREGGVMRGATLWRRSGDVATQVGGGRGCNRPKATGGRIVRKLSYNAVSTFNIFAEFDGMSSAATLYVVNLRNAALMLLSSRYTVPFVGSESD